MTSVAQIATLAYGYSMADIDRIANAAARRHRSTRRSFTDRDDHPNIAWDAIVDRLYSWPYTATSPVFFDLFTAALDALRRAEQAQTHHYGIPVAGEEAAHFTKYWSSVGGWSKTTRRRKSTWVEGAGDFTDHICEALALPRALAVLSADEYDAIATLAAFNNSNAAAAQALGWKYGTFTTRTDAARKAIKEVWFEGETPVRKSLANKDLECKAGHSRAEHGFREVNGQWRCRVCTKLKVRRARARQGGRVSVDLTPDPPEVLTFAPAPAEGTVPAGARTSVTNGEVVIGSTACWCGLHAGHDWPHKTEGAPHPTEVDAKGAA